VIAVDDVTKLKQLVGNDTLEIFGPSGSGKTTFALYFAYVAAVNDYKVCYIDSERNLNEDVEELKKHNITYFYAPRLQDIVNYCANLPKADLYVLDSIGFPVLAEYASASMREKGDMLLKCVALTQYLKIATWKNDALAIVTNQPVSEFGKNLTEDQLPPFGDKSKFGYKEIWRTYIVQQNSEKTECAVKAWRSRKFAKGKTLAQITITDQERKVELLV